LKKINSNKKQKAKPEDLQVRTDIGHYTAEYQEHAGNGADGGFYVRAVFHE
jgi:hypothetical protein